MEQPKGFECRTYPSHVCKLKKSLYVTPVDSNLFVKFRGEKMTIILVYVDDLIITGDHEEELKTKILKMRLYRKIVGSLIYLTLSGPDIFYIVGVASRFIQNPKKPHLEVVRRILSYVKGIIDFGILYRKKEHSQLTGLCDANYARDHDTRSSTTGYMFNLGSGIFQGKIEMKYTNDQVVDIFTKGFNRIKFDEFRKQFGMMTHSVANERL
ncbi:Retrovirus-related Pol polyprotein from transposon RE1-like protein, partial [Drosera capensis]